MKKFPHIPAFLALLPGLILGQVLATIQVFLANRQLALQAAAVRKSGYLMVPNDLVAPSLDRLAPALAGGLFYTLTAAAGLSLLAFAAAWCWNGPYNRRRAVLWLCILCWLILTAAAGRDPAWPVIAQFLLIPPLVFVATVRITAGRNISGPRNETLTGGRLGSRNLSRVVRFSPALGLGLLVLAWLPLFSGGLFFDIRDQLLLGNSLGRKINDFYYSYTLYAAQAIKPLGQRTVKTVYFEPATPTPLRDRLRHALPPHDYLPVLSPRAADLIITGTAHELEFLHRDRLLLTAATDTFLARPPPVLNGISQQADRLAFYRQFIALSLLLAYPCCLYILVHGTGALVLTLILSPPRAVAGATLGTLATGLLLAWPLYAGRIEIEPGRVNDLLTSASATERTAALRYLAEHGRSPAKLLAPQRVLTSPSIPERYWYVRGLGHGPRNAGTGKILERFLDDPGINVVCMAYLSLGRVGDPTLIPKLRRRFQRQPHWYVQWYAYRTLRALGWRQTAP